MRKITGAACGLAVACLAGAADAHHSYAMFDQSRQVTIEGTIAKFDWRNPHIYIWMYSKNPKTGKQDLYAVEGGSVLMLRRRGWAPDTFKIGEKVKLTMRPLRDGRHGGYFDGAVFLDSGKTLAGDGAGRRPGQPGGPTPPASAP